jgi:hypothetical protein
MISHDLQVLARQERYHDFMREAAQARLIHAGQDQHGDRRKSNRPLTSWKSILLRRTYRSLPCCTTDCCCLDPLQAIT